MRREFEERMDKMKGEVQKIQEEKVHLMGLEQRLRQEFQTQVQAEQMSNEELRIRSLFCYYYEYILVFFSPSHSEKQYQISRQNR